MSLFAFTIDKHSLTATNDALDAKCDDLQRQLAEHNRQIGTLQRKNEKLQQDAADAQAAQDAQRGLLRPLRPVDSFYGTANAGVEASSSSGKANNTLDEADGSGSLNNSGPESMAFAFRSSSHSFASSSLYGDDVLAGSGATDELSSADREDVLNDLNASRRQLKEEQQRTNDLEDQLHSMS